MLRRVLKNMSWAAGEQILRMGVGLLISLAIARQLGPEQFGIFNLVVATVGIVGSVIPLAADQVVQRELIAEPTRENDILGSATALRALAMALAVLVSSLAIFWIERDNSDRAWLAVLGAGTLLFQPLETISVWFGLHLRIRNVTLAKCPSFIAMTLARAVAIAISAPLLIFLAFTGLEAALAALGLIFVYRMEGRSIRAWRASRTVLLRLFSDSWPLLIGGFAAVLYMRLDVVMLAAMKGDAEVGIYSAATRISEVWYFIPMTLMASLQPVLFRLRSAAPARFRQRLLQTYTFLGWTSIVLAACVSLFSAWICTTLFGPRYEASGAVLAVHIWAAVPVFLGVISSSYLVTENLSKIAMYRTMIGLGVNVALNIILIPSYGAYGAAWATFVAYTVATFALIGFPATRAHGWDMVAALSPGAVLATVKAMRDYVLEQQPFK